MNVTMWYLLSSILLATTAMAAVPSHEERLATINDRYIVVFEDDVDVDSLVSRLEVDVASVVGDFEITRKYYAALKGIAVKLDAKALELVKAAQGVKYVEQDVIGKVEMMDDNPASWGLDRIDQRENEEDGIFEIDANGMLGEGVTVYLIDTGIRETHEDLGGRAVRDPELDFVGDGWDGWDCYGHGTHCAGTAAGATYGVARKANIVSLRIFDCPGFGTSSDAAAAIDWVTANGVLPAVMSMSFLFPTQGTAIEDAISGAKARGILSVAAAGNTNSDACRFTPARATQGITVGASDINDDRASFSCYGECVDIFAPGVAITSASPASDRATATWSGTSMACPHVAGVVAVHLSNGMHPDEVWDYMKNVATKSAINDNQYDTPNLLLYIE